MWEGQWVCKADGTGERQNKSIRRADENKAQKTRTMLLLRAQLCFHPKKEFLVNKRKKTMIWKVHCEIVFCQGKILAAPSPLTTTA
jgi:hypothetical protein